MEYEKENIQLENESESPAKNLPRDLFQLVRLQLFERQKDLSSSYFHSDGIGFHSSASDQDTSARRLH